MVGRRYEQSSYIPKLPQVRAGKSTFMTTKLKLTNSFLNSFIFFFSFFTDHEDHFPFGLSAGCSFRALHVGYIHARSTWIKQSN